MDCKEICVLGEFIRADSETIIEMLGIGLLILGELVSALAHHYLYETRISQHSHRLYG